VRWALATLTVLGCGRVGLDVGMGSGAPDAATDAPVDGSSSPTCGVATTGSCGPTSPFRRVQFVPSNCPVGTNCKIIVQAASQSQQIALTAGDLLVAFAYGGQNPGGSNGGTAPNMQFTVTDTLGNTFLPGPFVNNAKYNDSAIQMWFAANAKGGTTTVTASSSAPQNETFWSGLVLLEYSGVAASDVVDVASSTPGPVDAATITAPPITVRSECDLVVGGMTNGHVPNSMDKPSTGWEMPVLDEWDPAGFVDDAAIGASNGDSVGISIAAAGGADDGWASTQLAFRAATATAPCAPDGLAFTTVPQGGFPSKCMGPTTVATTRSGIATSTPTGAPIALTAAGSAAFYADAACSFQLPSTLVGAGTGSTTFWYATDGNALTITASSPGLGSTAQIEK
jgi:hypothetical protein